ncbi:hypothetical protein EV188_103425 [Actinomycetospora succinea]|uniref:Uncharacterized protein n=1 Tax=Actinomycetospora succinea TaxID=663603 RepID=A0A4R6VF27_9PSEU|nr:hypothetical protein [Actinomycetospora succinea]TDQ60921.1 hypothetical protein EV188_103425 [Actinomycetospora succinea]
MTDVRDHPYAAPYPGAFRPMGPPPGAPVSPFGPVPPATPPAGLAYGYPPPAPLGWGPPPPFAPPMPPPTAPPPPRRGRTALVAVALAVVLLGGIVAAVAIMAKGVASGPVPPGPAPAPVPASHHTLTGMFANNGSCTPTTAEEQVPSTTEGLVCTGSGDGTVFVFYRYTGSAAPFEQSTVRGWGGSGLTLREQDSCRAQYTGTIDLPGAGAAPVVVDFYRNSPFMAVSAAGNGQSVDSMLTPRYQVANRTDLCAGG